jgi:hypothetical protein
VPCVCVCVCVFGPPDTDVTVRTWFASLAGAVVSFTKSVAAVNESGAPARRRLRPIVSPHDPICVHPSQKELSRARRVAHGKRITAPQALVLW